MKHLNLSKYFLFFVATIFFSCKADKVVYDVVAEVWDTIFNGKNLDGWTIKIANEPLGENYKNTFTVDSQMLRISYDEYSKWDDKFGHIFFEKPMSYYKLKFDHRFLGEHLPDAPIWADKNSGIMVHSQSPQSMSFGQQFPISLEMQLLVGNDTLKNTTGNVCTPGTILHMGDTLRMDHCINSSSITYPLGEWIHGEIEVYGDSLVRHIINGETVLEFTKPKVGGGFLNPNDPWSLAFITDSTTWIQKNDTPLKTGYIALQAESQALDFKNIYLLNLEGCMDSRAKNYKSYYIKHDAGSCVYK
ncbi:MAG TPA: DUF1080 domain-containing protein [Saprospiraceae bacterium]|mgnify:CR=1 FL=1|nr:DUF1080 domain-containing protein [Saprospiraceae bacterium]